MPSDPSAPPALVRPPYCRLTVLTPRRRVDVALPADVPVAELVPMLLELLGEPGRTAARPPVAWQLTGAAGGVLPAAATLGVLGVLDGELLRIGPAAPPPQAPHFDEPVDALAAAGAPAADGHPGRGFARHVVVVLAVAAALVLGGIGSTGADGLTVGFAAALAAVAAVGAIGCAARFAATPAGTSAALAGVALGAAAGWAGMVGPAGPGHLLFAAAAGGTAAAAGQIAVRVVVPALIGLVVVAVAGVLGGLCALLTDAPAAALGACLAAAALAVGPLLPRCALRLAGLPRPTVPTDAGELSGADQGPDVLSPDELAERADLARGHLAGAVAGTSAVATVGAVLATGTGGWAGPVLAAVTAAVLLLRARGFADPVPVRALLVGGTATALGALAPVALGGGAGGRLGAGLVLLLAAAGAVAAARAGDRAGSPVTRRAVDMLEVFLVAVAVPLALGVAGLYALVHGL